MEQCRNFYLTKSVSRILPFSLNFSYVIVNKKLSIYIFLEVDQFYRSEISNEKFIEEKINK